MRINPEKKEDRERVRHALLRVTLRLANEHGFVSLGLREVSRAAEIAPTSFYRHFADMEELGRALVEELAQPLLEEWRVHAGGQKGGAMASASALSRAALASTHDDPELVRFILAERRGAIPTFRAALSSKLERVSVAFAATIGQEWPDSDASKRNVLAHAALVLVLDACGESLDGGEGTSGEILTRLEAELELLFAGAAFSGRHR